MTETKDNTSADAALEAFVNRDNPGETTEPKKGYAKGKLHPGRKVVVSFDLGLTADQIAGLGVQPGGEGGATPRERLTMALSAAIDEKLYRLGQAGAKAAREAQVAEIAEREKAASAELEELRAKRAELGRA